LRAAALLGGSAFAFEIQTATGFTSQPAASLPFKRLSNAVVPLPLKGSKTTSPCFDHARYFLTKVSGNIAKYGQMA
jgi:hypothetical protein